jgi:hypothetical protein
MKKTELKKVLKPLIKECIKEVMFEEGVLSGIISEVVKGLGTDTIVEQKRQPAVAQQAPQCSDEEVKAKLRETKSRMLDAIGKDAYGGIDLFEGTAPMRAESGPGDPMSGMDPGDPGVDISGILNLSGGNWGKLAG